MFFSNIIKPNRLKNCERKPERGSSAATTTVANGDISNKSRIRRKFQKFGQF